MNQRENNVLLCEDGWDLKVQNKPYVCNYPTSNPSGPSQGPEVRRKYSLGPTANSLNTCWFLEKFPQTPRILVTSWACAWLFVGNKIPKMPGTSLVVHRLKLCAPNVGDQGSIPGQGNEIPYAAQCGEREGRRERKKGKSMWENWNENIPHGKLWQSSHQAGDLGKMLK